MMSVNTIAAVRIGAAVGCAGPRSHAAIRMDAAPRQRPTFAGIGGVMCRDRRRYSRWRSTGGAEAARAPFLVELVALRSSRLKYSSAFRLSSIQPSRRYTPART